MSVIYARDDFNRANGALAGSTAQVGGNWLGPENAGTVINVSSNKAVLATSAASEDNLWLECGVSDNYFVEADFVLSAGANNGLCFRHSGATGNVSAVFNLFTLQEASGVITIYAYKVNLAAYTQLGATTTVTNAATNDTVRLKVTVSGNTMTGFVNGVQWLQVTDGNGSTNTKCGIRPNNANVGSIDNFLVWDGKPDPHLTSVNQSAKRASFS
jgi:hypothetical protein